MTFSIVPTITVNGIDYTNLTFNQVNIQYGRSKIFDTPRPGYATVEIANTTDTAYPFKINDPLVIKLENASSTDVTVFTGIITDVRGSFRNSDITGGLGVITLSAVAPMAQMSRIVVGSTAYPAETDAARIQRILTEAGVTIDVIDAAIYNLVARPASLTDAYTLANQYAMSVLGAIYETPDGKIGYANESRRTAEAQTSGFKTIPTSAIIIDSVASNENLSDVMNLTSVTYSAGTVSDQDVSSQTTYGIIGATFETELANQLDAESIAATYINLRSIPRKSLSTFAVRLLDPTLTVSLVNDLLAVYFGMPVFIPGLPNTISDVDYEGFVEGWNLSFSPANAVLTLKTSQEAYSYRDMRWQDVDPTAQWEDINPSATISQKTNLTPNPTFEPIDYGALGYFPVDYTRRQRIQFPDEAAFDITGDIDIRVKVSLDDWTPAVQQGVIARDTSGNRTWSLRVDTAGRLVWVWYPVTTALSATSTVATGFIDGSTNWIRVTMDVDNGAGSRVIQFFTSSDGLNWTQLGTTITTAGTTSIAATAAPIDLGFSSNSGLTFNGKMYAAEVRNGINGTVVLYSDIAGDWKPSNGFSYTAYSGQTGNVTNFTALQWGNNTGTTSANSIAQSYSGRGSLLVTIATTGTGRGVLIGTGYRPAVTVGTAYTLSGYVRDINTVATWRWSIQWYTAQTGGTLVSSSTGTATAITSTGWTRISVTGTCPATATHATLFLQSATSVTAGTQLYLDAVQFETGSTASTYFDGYASDIPAKEFPALAWTGIAQESSSTADAYWGTKPVTLWNNVDQQGIP